MSRVTHLCCDVKSCDEIHDGLLRPVMTTSSNFSDDLFWTCLLHNQLATLSCYSPPYTSYFIHHPAPPSPFPPYSSPLPPVNGHEIPISQMGNYQEHLKKINPLREVDTGAVRTQLFGNPYRLEKNDTKVSTTVRKTNCVMSVNLL